MSDEFREIYCGQERIAVAMQLVLVINLYYRNSTRYEAQLHVSCLLFDSLTIDNNVYGASRFAFKKYAMNEYTLLLL